MPAIDSSGWFLIPELRPDAHTRLFCLSHAGGWPWEYRRWPEALSGVEVRAVCLPGRGQRTAQPAATSLDALASAIAAAMRPYLDRPYAVFGHSFGALLAYEVAGALERDGAPAPRHVFLSGASVPNRLSERPPLHTISDDDLLAYMRSLRATPDPALDEPSIRALTLTLVRADLTLAEKHQSRTPSIAAPITAWAGNADHDAPRDAVTEWQHHTRAAFACHELPGDHFFIQSQAAALLATVYNELRS